MTRFLATLLLLTAPAMASHDRPPSTELTRCLSELELMLFLKATGVKWTGWPGGTIIEVHANQGAVLWVKNRSGAFCHSGQSI